MKHLELKVEECDGRFWVYYDGRRSAGRLPGTALHATLRWLLDQLVLGHSQVVTDDDNGDVIAMNFGKNVAIEADSMAKAAEMAKDDHMAVNVAGLIAEAREKGIEPSHASLEKEIWEKLMPIAHRRIEMHYARLLSQMLGRISKKLPKLESLPLFENAPESTRQYIAEATRCYLLNLNRACIAMCRACLEHTLQATLTENMRQEWIQQINQNKKSGGGPNQFHALIEVCAKHGILQGNEEHAHKIREAGNRILHLTNEDASNESAGDVLKKTRKLIGLIHGNSQQGDDN